MNLCYFQAVLPVGQAKSMSVPHKVFRKINRRWSKSTQLHACTIQYTVSMNYIFVHMYL